MGIIGAGRKGKVFAHTTIPYFMERFGKAYATEIHDFVGVLVSNREPSVTGLDARVATALGISATSSLDELRPELLDEIG